MLQKILDERSEVSTWRLSFHEASYPVSRLAVTQLTPAFAWRKTMPLMTHSREITLTITYPLSLPCTSIRIMKEMWRLHCDCRKEISSTGQVARAQLQQQSQQNQNAYWAQMTCNSLKIYMIPWDLGFCHFCVPTTVSCDLIVGCMKATRHSVLWWKKRKLPVFASPCSFATQSWRRHVITKVPRKIFPACCKRHLFEVNLARKKHQNESSCWAKMGSVRAWLIFGEKTTEERINASS